MATGLMAGMANQPMSAEEILRTFEKIKSLLQDGNLHKVDFNGRQFPDNTVVEIKILKKGIRIISEWQDKRYRAGSHHKQYLPLTDKPEFISYW